MSINNPPRVGPGAAATDPVAAQIPIWERQRCIADRSNRDYSAELLYGLLTGAPTPRSIVMDTCITRFSATRAFVFRLVANTTPPE